MINKILYWLLFSVFVLGVLLVFLLAFICGVYAQTYGL